MLIPIEKALNKDEVRQFHMRLDAATWRDGNATAGSLAMHVKRNAQLANEDPVAVDLGNFVLRRLGQTPAFIAAALPKAILPPLFNRYAGGGTYGAHVDGSLMQMPQANRWLRSDLSATLFLSEPDEYDGGELKIETPFGAQAVKLPAGDMVLYPSSSLHRVTPVTRGARIASVFWIESLVGDEAERALLYELDQTIQRLTPRFAADDPELLRLTGVYHNLLRRWAAT